MTRHGYVDDDLDLDPWELGQYRGRIASATRGKRGQRFFRDLVAALDAMPEKRLVAHSFQRSSDAKVCALGAALAHRGQPIPEMNSSFEDDWDCDTVVDPRSGRIADAGECAAALLDIAPCLAREVMFMNDDEWPSVSPERRWQVVRKWAAEQIQAGAE